MDNGLINKINEITKDKPIFYVTNDAERALGLEKLVQNFHIICIDDNEIVDYMKNAGVKVFCLEKELGEKNTIFRSSVKLLRHPKTQEYIKSFNSQGGFVMTFKISPAFEKFAQSLGLDSLNTTAALNRKYENKISQYQNLGTQINFPKTLLGELGGLSYESLISDLSKELVIQFDLGHTGSGTVFIKEQNEFEEIKNKFPKRMVRVSRKIEGDSYTINAMIGKKATLMAGLSYQITGVKELTDKAGGTVGNDFGFTKNLSGEQVSKVTAQVNKIAEILRQDGYLGFFGVDLIINSDEVYVIEINARQPASVPFVNKLQIKNNQAPLSAYHIASFAGIDFEVNTEEYNSKAIMPMEAGQIFLRNTNEDAFTVNGNVKVGEYRLQSDDSAIDWQKNSVKENVLFLDEEKDKPLIFQKDAYSIEELGNSGMLILTQAKGKSVNSGNELARIQSLQSLIGEDGKPFGWVLESLNSIKKYLE